MKLYEVTVHSEEDEYPFNECDTFVGIFEDENVAIEVGQNALEKILIGKIDKKRFYGRACFRGIEYEVRINEIELNQRYF